MVEVGSYVGMNIVRGPSRGDIFIHQKPYAEKVLEKFRMQNCKSVTPIESRFSADEESEIVDVPYRELIGSLMFLAICFKTLAFAVSQLSKFLSDFKKVHWEAAKRICST